MVAREFLDSDRVNFLIWRFVARRPLPARASERCRLRAMRVRGRVGCTLACFSVLFGRIY